MPMVWLLQPNCSFIGRIAMLMFTLSMLQSMNATKTKATIVYRRRHPVCSTATASSDEAAMVSMEPNAMSEPEIDCYKHQHIVSISANVAGNTSVKVILYIPSTVAVRISATVAVNVSAKMLFLTSQPPLR